jgi:hypothetical protein
VAGIVFREKVFLVPGADLHHVRHLCDGEAHEYAESSRNDHDESDQHAIESHFGGKIDGFRLRFVTMWRLSISGW